MRLRDSLFIACFLALGLVRGIEAQSQSCPFQSCSTDTASSQAESENSLSIRLWNRSDFDLEQVQLGESPHFFEDIPPGHITDMLPVATLNELDSISVVAEGTPYQTSLEAIQEHEDEPAAYLIALTIDVATNTLHVHRGRRILNVVFMGGLCQYGVCSQQIDFYEDGTVLAQSGNDTTTVKQIEPEFMERLVNESEAADFDDIRSVPFTEICPTAYDGQETVFSFFLSTGPEVVASCSVQVDMSHPLFVAVNAATEAWEQTRVTTES